MHCASHFYALSPLVDQRIDEWMNQYRINTVAPFALTRACLPLLKQAADASVVFVGETHGQQCAESQRAECKQAGHEGSGGTWIDAAAAAALHAQGFADGWSAASIALQILAYLKKKLFVDYKNTYTIFGKMQKKKEKDTFHTNLCTKCYFLVC